MCEIIAVGQFALHRAPLRRERDDAVEKCSEACSVERCVVIAHDRFGVTVRFGVVSTHSS